MKLNHAFLFLLSAAAVLQGCTGSDGQNDGQVLRPLDQTVETDDLSRYVKSVEFIALEEDTTFYLGVPSKIIRDGEGNFVIAGRNGIHRFSPEGKHLGIVGRIGRGPGEYAAPGDIALSDDTKSILVLNMSGVNIYDAKSGEFVKRVELPRKGYNDIFPAEDGGFLAVVPAPMEELESYNEVLYKFDSEGNGPIDSMIQAKDYTVYLGSLSSQSHDGGYLLRPLNGEWVLYKIKDGNVAPLYGFDFGSLQVPDGYMFDAGQTDFKRFMGSKYYKGVLYAQDTDDQLFFTTIGPNADAVHFVYDLDTQSGIRWVDTDNNARVMSSDNDGFYLYFEDLSSYAERSPEELEPLSRRIVSEYERQGIRLADGSPSLVKVRFGFAE